MFCLLTREVSRELDHAMLRRLEKRVLVDLPTKEARQAMFQQFLPPTVIQENNGLILYSDLDYGRLGNVCFSFDKYLVISFLDNFSVLKVIPVRIFDWFVKKQQ